MEPELRASRCNQCSKKSVVGTQQPSTSCNIVCPCVQWSNLVCHASEHDIGAIWRSPTEYWVRTQIHSKLPIKEGMFVLLRCTRLLEASQGDVTLITKTLRNVTRAKQPIRLAAISVNKLQSNPRKSSRKKSPLISRHNAKTEERLPAFFRGIQASVFESAFRGIDKENAFWGFRRGK